MPRPLRFIPEHSLVEITTRTLQGRLLLKPSPELTDLILGVIGKAQAVYGMTIYAFVFLSTHAHFLVSPSSASQLARFMQFANANVAKEAGRLHMWPERLWSRRYRAIVVADEKAAHARLRYLLAHGAKEGLLASPGDWPGPNCIAALTLVDPRRFLLFPPLNTRIVTPMFSVEELGLEIASLSAHLDAATHWLLTCIRQFDEQCGWSEQGAVSCAHWLSWRVGLDAATAREKVRVARALGKLPAIDDALRVGKLSYAKVRALTRVATPENEGRLLELALYATGAQLERLCRGFRSAQRPEEGPSPEDRCVRKWVLPGGMVRLEIVLSPDEAGMVLKAIDRAREVGGAERVESAEGASAEAETDDESPAWPSRPDGVVTMAEAFLAGNEAHGTGGDRYQVMVHVDQDPLAPDGVMAATLEDGTAVSAEALRRIACDCGIVAVSGSDPAGMSVGRRTRAIPPAIRRALMLRDRGCSFPGCTHTRFLHGHHWRHWLHGGETSLANLLLLCPRHHRLVHEGGFSVERDEEGRFTFVASTGKRVGTEAQRVWHEKIVTWLEEWAEAHALEIGPETNEPLWDGSPLDYDHAVSALLAAG